MSTWPDCSACGARLQVRMIPRGLSPAAPYYFCPACEARATDAPGKCSRCGCLCAICSGHRVNVVAMPVPEDGS